MLFGLPDCDKVFMKYFDRWYEPADRTRKVFPATRPDALMCPDFRGLSPQQVSQLAESAQSDVAQMVLGIIEAAQGDWRSYLSVSEPMDVSWIDAFDKYYDKRRVKNVLKSSDPKDFSNDLLILCCEFGAVLGDVMLKTLSNLHWVYSWPYWESSVFDPETGQIIAVFHWAIKKFSSYGIDDGYKAKLGACMDYVKTERGKLRKLGPQ